MSRVLSARLPRAQFLLSLRHSVHTGDIQTTTCKEGVIIPSLIEEKSKVRSRAMICTKSQDQKG